MKTYLVEKTSCLTHLFWIDFPSLINWTSPFTNLWLTGGVFSLSFKSQIQYSVNKQWRPWSDTAFGSALFAFLFKKAFDLDKQLCVNFSVKQPMTRSSTSSWEVKKDCYLGRRWKTSKDLINNRWGVLVSQFWGTRITVALYMEIDIESVKCFSSKLCNILVHLLRSAK